MRVFSQAPHPIERTFKVVSSFLFFFFLKKDINAVEKKHLTTAAKHDVVYDASTVCMSAGGRGVEGLRY